MIPRVELFYSLQDPQEGQQLRALVQRSLAGEVLHVLVLTGAVAFFAICTAAGAQLRMKVPFSPVPVTAQTFFVLLSGALLGRRLGLTAQALYLVLAMFVPGAAAGPLHLTGGYVIGFVVAAYTIGALAAESRSFPRVVGAMAIGSFVIYLVGAVWLAAATGHIGKAIVQGVVPFIPGDAIKLLAAAAIVTGGRLTARMRANGQRGRTGPKRPDD